MLSCVDLVASSFIFGKVADKFGLSPIVLVCWLSHAIFFVGYFAMFGLELVSFDWLAANPWFIFVTVGFYSIGDAGIQLLPATMIGALLCHVVLSLRMEMLYSPFSRYLD